MSHFEALWDNMVGQLLGKNYTFSNTFATLRNVSGNKITS
jgi:hypothetical protein